MFILMFSFSLILFMQTFEGIYFNLYTIECLWNWIEVLLFPWDIVFHLISNPSQIFHTPRVTLTRI